MAENLGSQSGIEGSVAADQLRTKPADSGVSEVLKYGQVHIQAKLGAFENEEQNCLLAFWDMQCLYKISDKNKILHSAGKEVIQKWNEHKNGRQFHRKVILVTPGNNLKYMKIIHVASDITSIYDDAKAGLRKADTEEMKTIVVPIYDDDPFYRDVNKFCTGILRAIKELATELKFVESVTLVIQGKRIFSFFSDIFELQSRQYGTGKKTDPAMMARKRGCQENNENEPSPDLQEEMAPKPTSRKKQTLSSKSVEEKITPRDWRCNEGNAHVIKLLINYKNKQGEKIENDVSKHLVSCSLNFCLIWNFYTQTDCGRKMLDAIVAKHDCKVSLRTDELKEIFIFQVTNVEFEENSDAKSYVDGVIDSVYISAQESLSIDSIRVDPGIQDDVREKLKERKRLNSAWIEFINEGTQVTVYTVCDKEHQQSVGQIITELAEDATKSFNSHIEMVTADFMWQRVMTRFEYLKEIGSKFPNTVIIQDENVNAFQLKGRRDEVKVVVGYLEKLLKTAQNEFHMKVFSSVHQFEIFTYPEMCSYINEFLPNLPLVWIPNHLTKKIHLFSRDQKHFKGIDKLIEGCVKERFYPLSEGYSKLPSEKIHSLEELKKTYKGQIVINPSDSPTGLLVTVADEIFKSVDDKVLEIIISETVEVHPETPVPEKHGKGGHPSYNPELGATNPEIKMSGLSLEKVPVSDKIVGKVFEVKDKILFRKLCMEDMAKLNQVAKEHCVSLRQLESQGSRVGFELKGPEKEVHYIYEYLTERIQAEEQQMQLQNDNSGMAASTEKVEQAPSSGTAEMSEDSKLSGNVQDIKLLINYQKKQGEKNENDVSKHWVSCSLNFHLIWNFYTQTDCGRKMLDAIVAKHDCKVSLPTDQLKEFFIFQVSNVEFEENSDAKSYVDGVIDSVYISAQESLSIDSIRVDPGIQDDVRVKLKERKRLNSAWIEFINEGTQVTVYTVCDKEHQQSVGQIITELAEDATKSFNSHIEMVTADFMWQRVMTRFEYLKEIGSKFPNTVIIQDENVNAFQLKGRRDEVKVVAGYLEKLLKTAQNEFHMKVFSSVHQFEIFTYPEMCSYINEFLPNLPLVWIPNHLTKKIHLFSRDQKHFKCIDKLIEGCVKERFYPLSEGYSKLPSEKIHSLEELKKTYKGQIVINPSDSPTGLLVTVADEIFKSVDDKVLEIIISETVEVHPETPVPEKHGKGGHPSYNPELGATNPEIKMSGLSLEKVPVSDKIVGKVFEVKDKILFRKLCMEDMAKLNQVAKEHCVSLRQLESQGSRVGFELKGPEKEVHYIYEYLTERIQAEEQQMQLQNDNSGMAASTEKVEQAPSSGTAEMSEDSKLSGNVQDIKLQIKYQKKQGEKNENDVLKHWVSCSLNFHLIWNFYTQTDCGRKMLDAIVAKHDCKVSLPTDQLKEFFIFQVSNVEFEEELDAKSYVDGVIDSVYISAQESLSINSIRVDPGIQDDVREKLKERKRLNSAWIEFINEGTQVTVYTVCDKEHQQSVVQIIIELAEDATKSFNSHIEMVTADFMWQRVMTRFEYLKEIESKFPNTVIIQDENVNAFLLKGRRDEVRVVAGYLEKLLKTAQNEFYVQAFSLGYQFQIFTYPEMFDYIDGSIPKLPLVWIPNHLTKKIHLFSRDQKHFRGIDKLIAGCVKERFYPLSEGYSKLPSEKIHSLEELNKTYIGQIVIHPSDSPTGLLVTVADEIFQSVDVKMRKIISSEMGEVHPETPLPEKCGKGGHPGYNPEVSATNPEIKMSIFSLEKVQVSDKNVAKVFEVKDKILFRKLCMEDMAEMSQEAKEHCVSLHQLESQSGRVGFELKGPEKEVHHIYEYITERIQAEEQQMQLQNDNSGMAAGIKKAEQAPSPGTAEMPEDSKMSAIAEEPGLEQRDWSYPNGKKITLLKATSCDADVIIIPGNSDQDSFFKRIRVKVQKGQLHEAQVLQIGSPKGNPASNDRAVDDLIAGVSGLTIKDDSKGKQLNSSSVQNTKAPGSYPYEKQNKNYELKKKVTTDNQGQRQIMYNSSGQQTPQEFELRVMDKDKTHLETGELLPTSSENKVSVNTKDACSENFVSQTAVWYKIPIIHVSESTRTRLNPEICKLLDAAYQQGRSEVSFRDKDTGSYFIAYLENNSLFQHGSYKLHARLEREQAVTIQPVRWAHKSRVKVRVKMGTFENETPDCLLVFWDKRCLDKISDKSILLELAGKEVKEKWMEHRKKGGFERNVVFVTAGGKLKCQRIFHVACDITSYIIAAKDGLTRADQYKMKTVVIPLLQNETFMIDVNKYQKEMVKAIQDLTTGLKVVQSVTLVIQGKCDLPLLNEVFQKKNKVLGTRKKPEDDKRGHRSVNKEQWVAPSRSVPPETMAQNVSPDEPVHDIKTYLRPMTDIKELKHGTKPFKVEQLQPQDLDLHAPDCLVERVQNTGQKETLFANLKDLSGVEINMKDNRGATTQETNIAKHCLESSTPYEELCGYRTSINNVSELEFKALQIIKNGFRKEEGVHISWDGHSVVICGSPTLALCVKKCLTGIVMALRCKQSEEIFLDEEEKKIVRAVIEEVQSEDTICVFDEQMNQVAVYSDKQDDIRKFKHKLKIQTGKVKESGRSKHRFVGNSPLLEECQEKFSFLHKSTAIQQELSLSKNEYDVEIFYTKENIKISVYKANILNLPVDCIVNAANDTLQHGGGVCKVIADAAGSELVQEGDAIIKEMKNGKIPVACQVTTTAGRLPYRCVIHTVGPCWADYKPHNLQKVKDCEKDLYAAIFGCFSEAEKNGLSSIALPAVSSGIYDVPQDMCAVQYAKAVLDYSRKSRQGQALKEIHFIDKCSSLVKLMQDTFRTMIQEGKVPNFNIQNYVASSSSHQIEQSKDTGRKEHGKQDLEVNETVKLKELSPFYYESDVRHTKQFVFQVSAKPVVCIYEGDILKVKNMDAVVCPDDTNGLGKGSISVDLRTKTKYKQQKEKCFEKQKPNLGDVVITYGEETTFNVIVHVVIENNSPQKPGFMSTMKKSIDNILRKTNEWVCVKTIAMTLFGVEQELLTEKSWAELFLERFVAFYCEVENSNLEEVHIVTHCSSGSAYSTLKKVFIDFADEVNKTHIQEKESPPRPIVPKDSRTSNDTKQRAELCSPAKRTQNKMQLPSHWTSMKVTDVLQVPLDSKDIEAAIRDEYSMVKRDFDKTMSGAEIVSVKRIQNALLWEHYALQKKEMEIKAGGEGLVNEMHLYHGTTPDAVDLICHSNFDFRMAGERVGAKYGQGAYFASDARYSDSYTVRDDRNHKFMFVAKVLIGKTCLGKPPYKKPPYLDDNDKKKGTYNTCVNDVSNPTVYCVFDKNQYYPEYLVEYKLKVKESSV